MVKNHFGPTKDLKMWAIKLKNTIVMANKTYVVTSVEAAPYTLLRESPHKLNGNNRFEGYGIDLMTEIAKFLQFNVTFKLVDDGKYGGTDEHGNWNGRYFFLIKSRSSSKLRKVEGSIPCHSKFSTY